MQNKHFFFLFGNPNIRGGGSSRLGQIPNFYRKFVLEAPLSSPSKGFVKKFIFFHPVVPGSSKGDTFPEKAQLWKIWQLFVCISCCLLPRLLLEENIWTLGNLDSEWQRKGSAANGRQMLPRSEETLSRDFSNQLQRQSFSPCTLRPNIRFQYL